MTMKGPQQQALEAEFPEEMLKLIRKGGSNLTYIPVGEATTRMNDVLGTAGWEWKNERLWREMGGMADDDIWCLASGHLTATIDGVTSMKSGVGGVKVKMLNDGSGAVDLGDEYKGADSDAMKKAMQRFGVGLYLARTKSAIDYELPAPRRDPVDEGWESAEQAAMETATWARLVKGAGRDEEAKSFMRYHNIVWPPTRRQFEALQDWFAADQYPEPQPEPEAAPEAPVQQEPPPPPPEPTQVRSEPVPVPAGPPTLTLDDVPGGSIADVMAWVHAGDVRERAELALERETLTRQRKTGIKALKDLIKELGDPRMVYDGPSLSEQAMADGDDEIIVLDDDEPEPVDETPANDIEREALKEMLASLDSKQSVEFARWRRGQKYPSRVADFTREQVFATVEHLS